MKKNILDTNFKLFLDRFKKQYNFKKISAESENKFYHTILTSRELKFNIPVVLNYKGGNKEPIDFNNTFNDYQLGLIIHASGTCIYEKEFYSLFKEPIADGDVNLFREDIFTAKEFNFRDNSKESMVLNDLIDLILKLHKTPSTPRLTTKELHFERYTKTIYLNESRTYLRFLADFIVSPPKTGEVYRYMDFNGAFQIINSQKYRLSSIMGMNDQTEGASFVNSIYSNIPHFKPSFQINTIRYFNNIFISSCTDKSKESLTMWRLYGDNSKGSCLKLYLNSDNNKINDSILFGRVNYVPDINQRVNALNELMTSLHEFSSYILDPRILYYVSCFTKDEQYKDENEVRILLDLNDSTSVPGEIKWSVVDKLNIVRPFKDIPLEFLRNFVLISEVILGPNCPQQGRNINQLKILHEQMGIYPIEIKASVLKPDLYLG